MKKIIKLLTVFLCATMLLPACAQGDEDPAASDSTVHVVEKGKSDFTIVRSDKNGIEPEQIQAAQRLKEAFLQSFDCEISMKTDRYRQGDKEAIEDAKNALEILVGSTNREESQNAFEKLSENEYVIRVEGKKIVICGGSGEATLAAVNYFIDNYMKNDDKNLKIPKDISVSGTISYDMSYLHNMTFDEMGDIALSAFYKELCGNGTMPNTEFWDAAEILEVFIDAYERTGKEEYFNYVERIANYKFSARNENVNWCQSNAYNDDIAWAAIGFTRIYLLTNEERYLTIAKNNFDTMWRRAYSPDVLGGGLWWKDDQKDTKNSCIQCPASIAACLLGKALNDDSYYEKAKELMEWEFANLFEEATGRVYDAYKTDGSKNNWASTYNQGTFVGACTLLHEKYGDEKYLDYAKAAVNFAVKELANSDGILNGEDSGNDLIGFKGILTRWFYRYALYTKDFEVVRWLQNNANTAFRNRNNLNLIWTTWANKTLNGKKQNVFGYSTAVALMFNCCIWQEK